MRSPLSLEAFADWLEQQPATATYDYTESDNCAVAQYLRSLGLTNVNYVAWSGLPSEGKGPRVPLKLFAAANPPVVPLTFGVAAKHARKLLRRAHKTAEETTR